MRRMRAWQEAGHTAVIIIGDWTARIGDPSGRSETRSPLTPEQVEENAQTYLAQLFAVLDRRRTEVRFQSEWFSPMGLADVLRLAASRTVQQMLQRKDFSDRLRDGHAISTHELLYPLLQGYDSVAVDADVEIGGTDQLFNLLAARDVQRFYGRAEAQDVVTFPILEGLDGVRKMSKSYGNYIGVAEPAEEQYGKAMSIPDSLIVRYLTLVTDLPAAEIDGIAQALATDGMNPRDAKAVLARAIVRQFHGEEAAQAAERRFRDVVGGGGVPADAPAVPTRLGAREAFELVREVVVALGQPPSNKQLSRLFDQGGIAIAPPGAGAWTPLAAADRPEVAEGTVLKVGKRSYARLVSV
jgi:tyrosyl-tRNA synthetase